MEITGEIVAEKFHVTREGMDRFALESQRRAASATQEGRFKEQIVPVEVPGAGRVEVDEGIRTDTSLEKLARLPPVFREGGQVTAGNASQLSDGAVALCHPIGCSGARVLTTLIYAMKDRGAKRGLATLCLGGGNAVSMIIERP